VSSRRDAAGSRGNHPADQVCRPRYLSLFYSVDCRISRAGPYYSDDRFSVTRGDPLVPDSAERWAATEPDKPFPARLLIRTEVIDKDRAEFLLSLA
jgi:hypothetical protein